MTWHSYHLHRPLPLDRPLLEEVKPLVESLGLPYFFLRYNKPEWHIRLRINSPSPPSVPFVPSIPYVPELARYGGPTLMPIAEAQFHLSSKTVLSLIATPDWSYDHAIAHAMRMHLALAEAFAIEPRAFFGETVRRFRKMRDPQKRSRDQYEPAPFDDDWRTAMREIATRMGAIDPDIVQSFVHMTNNRLGIHFGDEAFVARMILRALE